jgi:glycosyltransferase involved in cell wall biosynthesis
MKLSIITVNLNDKEGLRKTMDSVFSQSFTDYEYIIVDGGSTDGSVELIKEAGDKVDKWVSEPDTGIYNAMNKGISMASGEYVNFLNAGDWYVEEVLNDIFGQERDADILYGDQYFIREGGKLQLKTKPAKLTLFDFYWGSLYHQTSFIRRKLFDNDLYNEKLKIISDAEFYLKKIIIEGCSYQHIGLPVVYYNTGGLSSSDKAGEIIKEERKYLHDKYFPKYVLDDYAELLQYKRSPLYTLIPELNRTTGFKNFVARVDRVLIVVYKMIKRDK